MPNIKYVIKDAIQSVPVLYRLVRRVRRGCNRALRDDWAGQQRLYGQFIGRDDLVFDVGANKGNKSEVFASLGARVVAYEPIPACAELTARRCPSSRVSVQRVAVSSEAGTARLWIVEDASQVASIEEEWTADVSGQCRTFIDVATTTLNAEIAKHGRPQFLKIDVEGHELAVLQGLSQPVPAISIEWHHRPSDIEKVDKCVARLKSLGFRYAQTTFGEVPAFVWSDWKRISELMPSVSEVLPRSRDCGFGDLFFVQDR